MSKEEAYKLAEQIYLDLFGKPKDHQQWTEAFNKRGAIVRAILSKVSHVNPTNH